ncbi:hypothetical protein BEL04_21075 [Mucilaginibacter sp. PPCGB 2223]|nr:hypothetical protein BEL04_21075 [Mucilaginibacter sp. PPCGB 2223]
MSLNFLKVKNSGSIVYSLILAKVFYRFLSSGLVYTNVRRRVIVMPAPIWCAVKVEGNLHTIGISKNKI